MDDQTIKALVEEIGPKLVGQPLGKIFQLSRASLALDFRLHNSSYLFISVEPAAPRLYIIERRVRELEKQSLQPSSFVNTLRKYLGGARLLALVKDEGERIVRLAFAAQDEMGNRLGRSLVVQLTGRASNLLVLDEGGHIIDALRASQGQEIGSLYAPPPAQGRAGTRAPLARGSFPTLSEAADDHYRGLEAARAFNSRAAAARQRLRKEISQRTKLRGHLLDDLARHGDAEEHRRIGELLLANIGTAERHGSTATVTDYYTEGTPRVELQLDENRSLQEEAAQRFARYTKAKRAAQEIARRLAEIDRELAELRQREAELERVIAAEDEAALASLSGEAKQEIKPQVKRRKSSGESVASVRRYRSSDGYEILVGRGARDNDQLTFRLARPLDLWLHAADYTGSHVLIRNPARSEIPHRTIIEAAQLAARFSHARHDSKVAVHYTQRKFLSKPKGSAPGLVRMSSFRTITVEPAEPIERI
ncbi:MAG TPA: NFACT family protein [Pyrinomonadaceae bacterium]|jgi:predicted ribosome quality control (RQC) complex YloA/Tae2 family protein